MLQRTLLILAAVGGLFLAFFLGRSGRDAVDSSPVPNVAASVDSIRQMGDLVALRASVQEFATAGTLAIVCRFDTTSTYDLRKARIVAGARDDGSRYCSISLPTLHHALTPGTVRIRDRRDGTWRTLAEPAPPGEATNGLDAARAGAEAQARAALAGLEAETQASARAMLGQIARAFGFTDVTVEFDK